MSQDSYYQRPAPEPAKAADGAWRWWVPSLALTAVGLAALASCGPDSGSGAPSASNSAPSASVNAASASVLAAAPASAPVAPACPKVVEPKCPAAPSVAPKPLSARTAAIWSGASRRAWRRHGHRHAYADARRRWDHGRPWPGDRPDGPHYGYLDEGPHVGDRLLGGYRSEEDANGTERSEFPQSHDGARVVERYREEAHGGRPCPLDCRGGLPGDWRWDGYRAAGVDERGYLVWPGKVEY